jgi:hypothetical protein
MIRRLAIVIAVFYAFAVGLSYAAAQLPATNSIAGFRMDGGLLIGLGPLLGTVAACIVLRQAFPSLFGHEWKAGVLAMAVPIVLAAIVGFGKTVPAGIAGLIFGASIVVYCLCEEAGWRGFLTGNLLWMKEWHADLLTGILWFAWHFTFMPEMYDPDYLPGFTAAIIAGSFGLAATRRFTGGFALAAGWHTAVKLTPIGPLAFVYIAFLAYLTWQAKKASISKSSAGKTSVGK